MTARADTSYGESDDEELVSQALAATAHLNATAAARTLGLDGGTVRKWRDGHRTRLSRKVREVLGSFIMHASNDRAWSAVVVKLRASPHRQV